MMISYKNHNKDFIDKENICPLYGKNDRQCYKCKHVAYNFDAELDCNISGKINREFVLDE
jgi:hypothetical protein